jgi:hypothetical protein
MENEIFRTVINVRLEHERVVSNEELKSLHLIINKLFDNKTISNDELKKLIDPDNLGKSVWRKRNAASEQKGNIHFIDFELA